MLPLRQLSFLLSSASQVLLLSCLDPHLLSSCSHLRNHISEVREDFLVCSSSLLEDYICGPSLCACPAPLLGGAHLSWVTPSFWILCPQFTFFTLAETSLPMTMLFTLKSTRLSHLSREYFRKATLASVSKLPPYLLFFPRFCWCCELSAFPPPEAPSVFTFTPPFSGPVPVECTHTTCTSLSGCN